MGHVIPLTGYLIGVYFVAGILPDDYPAESKRVFAEGRRVLSQAFGFQEGAIPAWMFRTGKSSPLPAEMRTLRLPLARVIRSESDAVKL